MPQLISIVLVRSIRGLRVDREKPGWAICVREVIELSAETCVEG